MKNATSSSFFVQPKQMSEVCSVNSQQSSGGENEEKTATATMTHNEPNGLKK